MIKYGTNYSENNDELSNSLIIYFSNIIKEW